MGLLQLKGLAVAERTRSLGVARMVAFAEGNLWALVYVVPPGLVVGHILDVANIRRIGPKSHALADVDALPACPAYVAVIVCAMAFVIGTDAAAPRTAVAASMSVHTTAGNSKHAEGGILATANTSAVALAFSPYLATGLSAYGGTGAGRPHR